MKIKLENDKKTKNSNILQVLKRIFLGVDEIEEPGLEALANEYDKIPDAQKTDEDKMNAILIKELQKSQSKIDIKDVLKVKPHKLKEETIKKTNESTIKKSNKKEKERID